MAELTLGWIAEKTGGSLASGDPASRVSSFIIDSRQAAPGDLFFAVAAARDGHDFAGDAAARGALGAVVSRPVEGLPPGFAVVRVPDTVLALRELGRAVLALRPRWVAAVTGSVGKTTTKEFTAALLSRKYVVLKSEGNFNNRLGLALSLLRLEERHSAAVLEMGMSAPGEIRDLTAAAPPDVAIITNVSPAHLEFLGSLDAVARAKWEIVEGLKPGGTAVLNGDDGFLRSRASDWKGRILRFGLGEGCDVRARAVAREGFAGYAFDLVAPGYSARTRLAFLTEAYLYDALAAAAAALASGVPFPEIAASIEALRPAPRRGLWHKLGRGVVLVDDSYNSNPAALDAALRGLAGLPAARRVAVLGDMLELGPDEVRFHEEAGRAAAGSGWDVLVVVGPRARHAAEAALAAGLPARSLAVFETSAAAAAAMAGLLRPGDLVLVKGSRGARMEIVVETIKDLFKE